MRRRIASGAYLRGLEFAVTIKPAKILRQFARIDTVGAHHHLGDGIVEESGDGPLFALEQHDRSFLGRSSREALWLDPERTDHCYLGASDGASTLTCIQGGVTGQ